MPLDRSEARRLMVTGGAGFIGSHIVEQALAEQWQVAVLDDLSTGRRENVPERAELFVVDVRNREEVLRAFEAFRPDVVSHQAAQASVAISVREPLFDVQTNVVGTINVLDAARIQAVGRVIFASTGGAIYGEVPEREMAAESWPGRPFSPYAASKMACEGYLSVYREQYGLVSTILRYGNVYGPRQDPHGEAGVVAIFAERLLRGQPIRINARVAEGDAGCVRDYVYVRDVVSANLAAALGKVPDPVLNVGTGIPTTTFALAKQLERHVGHSAEVGFSETRPGDLERSVLDPSRLRAVIGEPTSLSKGIPETAAWFREQVG